MSTKLAAERTSLGAQIALDGVAWIWRCLFTAAIMFVWLVMILFILPMFLNHNEGYRGTIVTLPLNILFVAITLLYSAGAVPFFLLPTHDRERFRWFVTSALGWTAMLVGSIVYLMFPTFPPGPGTSLIQLNDLAASCVVPLKVHAGIVAGIFLIPMLCLFFVHIPNLRRLIALIAMLVCWLAIELDILKTQQVSEGIAQIVSGTATGALAQICTYFISVAAAGLALALAIPEEAEDRGDAASVVVLLWLVILSGFICFQVARGEMNLREGNHEPVFHVLVASIFISPFANWIGMPFANGKRLPWILCFAISLAVMTIASGYIGLGDGLRLVTFVFREYNGPVLYSR